MLVYDQRKHVKSILRFTQKLLNGVNGLKNLLDRVKVILGSSDKLQGHWSLMLNLENSHYLLTASMLILNLFVCQQHLFVLLMCSTCFNSQGYWQDFKIFCVFSCAMQTFKSFCALLLERMTFNPRCLALQDLVTCCLGMIGLFYNFYVLCRLFNRSVRSYWSE